MMRVDVDVTDVLSHCRANQKALSGFAERCQAALERAIRIERRTHDYRNQTGNLQAQTKIMGQATGGNLDCDIGLHAPYGSHVQKRGLSRFDELYGEALVRINDDVVRMVTVAES